MLKEFLYNVENYGNAEVFVRDYDYPNTAWRYVLKIDKNIIKLKKYWCVYMSKYFDESAPDYIDSPLKYCEYVSDDFAENLAEIIISSSDVNDYCTHNYFIDNDDGKKMGIFINPILKDILYNDRTIDLYHLGDIDSLYNYIIEIIEEYLFKGKKIIDDIPLNVYDIVDIFQDYTSLSAKEYKKIKKTKTVDSYDDVIRKLKL